MLTCDPLPADTGVSMKNRAIILFLAISLCIISTSAFAVGVAAKKGNPLGGETTAITAVDNTTLYIVTAKGNLYSQDNTTAAWTFLKNIPKERATAVVTNGTYVWIGTGSGRIYRYTIADGVTGEVFYLAGQAVVGMKWDATLSLIWATTSRGQTYSCTP
jgi:photosystem II stability/assembly factor-like uncharacterized protein